MTVPAHLRVRSLALALLGLSLAGGAAAQSLPPGFEAVQLPGSFLSTVGIAFAPNGTAFLIRQDGRVNIHRGNSFQTTLFLDLGAEVNQDGDRGLIGIALHPGFVANGGPTSWVYLAYTVSPVPGQDMDYNENDQYSFSRLTRYKARTTAGNIVADVTSRQVLLGNQLPDGSVPDCIASLHNSHSNGSLIFGADGTLLVLTGDGAHYDVLDPGGVDDPGFDDWIHPVTGLRGPTPKEQDHGAFRSQMLNTLAGKVLRIDPETGLGLPSNPFFDGDPASHASRVWALGLRNPFRGSLIPGTGSTDPSLGDPGTVVLGDVGRSTWEEIDVCTGGENFGWPCFEGLAPLSMYQTYDPPGAEPPPCSQPFLGNLTDPIISWNHSNPASYTPAGTYQTEDGTPLPGFFGVCTGGAAAYSGGGYPDSYDGRVFFADYALGWIHTAELDAASHVVALRPFFQTPSTLTGLARHPITGDIHYISNFSGKLVKIRYLDPESIQTLGCGVNPAGSLDIVEPVLTIGSTVHFTIDNPLGTQSPGSATVLAMAALPDASHPCGTLLEGFGMAGLGAFGELLLNPLPGSLFDPLPGPVWPGTPVNMAAAVPFLYTLVGHTVYVQAAIVDPTFGGGSGAGVALTSGLEIRIGS